MSDCETTLPRCRRCCTVFVLHTCPSQGAHGFSKTFHSVKLTPFKKGTDGKWRRPVSNEHKLQIMHVYVNVHVGNRESAREKKEGEAVCRVRVG